MNLSYDLLKELKDSGFPQRFPKSVANNPELMKDIEHKEGIFYYKGYETYYNPTLSELIEACEEDFHSLTRVGKIDKICDEWWARSQIHWVETNGSTPEEAVALLYIALNQPKSLPHGKK